MLNELNMCCNELLLDSMDCEIMKESFVVYISSFYFFYIYVVFICVFFVLVFFVLLVFIVSYYYCSICKRVEEDEDILCGDD